MKHILVDGENGKLSQILFILFFSFRFSFAISIFFKLLFASTDHLFFFFFCCFSFSCQAVSWLWNSIWLPSSFLFFFSSFSLFPSYSLAAKYTVEYRQALPSFACLPACFFKSYSILAESLAAFFLLVNNNNISIMTVWKWRTLMFFFFFFSFRLLEAIYFQTSFYLPFLFFGFWFLS